MESVSDAHEPKVKVKNENQNSFVRRRLFPIENRMYSSCSGRTWCVCMRIHVCMCGLFGWILLIGSISKLSLLKIQTFLSMIAHTCGQREHTYSQLYRSRCVVLRDERALLCTWLPYAVGTPANRKRHTQKRCCMHTQVICGLWCDTE